MSYIPRYSSTGCQGAQNLHRRLVGERRLPRAMAGTKLDAARDLLAPVYGWFTEGLDTHGLKQARQILEDLE